MSDRRTEQKRRRRNAVQQIAQGYRTAHEVFSGALSLGLVIGAGYWLDQKLSWSPVLTICGACVGFVVAGVSLRTLLRRLDQETKRARTRQPGTKEGQSE